MTKDVMDAIRDRRSIRKFKPESLPPATVSRILEAALWAPSAGNLQPWKFYAVYNQSKKEEIMHAALNQKVLAEAPLIVVVCADTSLARLRYGERGEKLYCLQDTAAAVQNMLLAATAFGVGSLWVGAFQEEMVKQILEIQGQLRPVAIIALGYAEMEPNQPSRRSLEEAVYVVK